MSAPLNISLVRQVVFLMILLLVLGQRGPAWPMLWLGAGGGGGEGSTQLFLASVCHAGFQKVRSREYIFLKGILPDVEQRAF